MIRIDMSEYTESHSVARLIGAPPGKFIDIHFLFILIASFRSSRLCRI